MNPSHLSLHPHPKDLGGGFVVRPRPHNGPATVLYLLERAVQRIEPGAIKGMTADMRPGFAMRPAQKRSCTAPVWPTRSVRSRPSTTTPLMPNVMPPCKRGSAR